MTGVSTGLTKSYDLDAKTADQEMRVSVIIPTLNEEKNIRMTLESLKPIAPYEVIVADGGSTDRTREISQSLGASVLSVPCGRGRQMNEGARRAKGDVLLFLHADTRLPPSTLDDVRTALTDPQYVGGRFDVKLDNNRWMLGLVGRLISLRSRLTKVATGDQAIFVRRETFESIGGYPDIPLMEDIALSRALKRTGRIACLKSRVITSARRWETEGLWRTVFKMWVLKFLYLSGVSPVRLKRFYSDDR
jgi:rSAM/selenodomain-associated transferase 2